MGSAFHQLCQIYSGALTPSAPTASGIWENLPYLLYSKLSSEEAICDHITDDLPPKITILNIVIPILMRFFIFQSVLHCTQIKRIVQH